MHDYPPVQRKCGLEPGYTPEEWSKDLCKPLSSSQNSGGKENRGSDSNRNSSSKKAQKTTMISTTGDAKYRDRRPQTARVFSKEDPIEEEAPVTKSTPRVIKPIGQVVEKAVKNFLQKKHRHIGDVEQQLWKSNITYEGRKKKDFLDVSNEDFSKYETVDIMGNRVTPSTFNIFRDSLRKNRNEIHQRMLENLPDMNDNDEDSDTSNPDYPIIPLDFRTAMINNGTKLIIQAKSKEFNTVDQEIQKIEKERQNETQDDKLDPDKAVGDTDAYLKSLKMEAFDP